LTQVNEDPTTSIKKKNNMGGKAPSLNKTKKGVRRGEKEVGTEGPLQENGGGRALGKKEESHIKKNKTQKRDDWVTSHTPNFFSTKGQPIGIAGAGTYLGRVEKRPRQKRK